MIANPLFSSLRINNIANYKSQRLSGGQNRRLVLFLTLFYNPRIVFLDEPFNDIDERKNMIAILKNYCFSNHIQIILISHSIYELKQLTKMGVFLSNNKKKNKIYSTKQLNGLLIKKFKSQ
ncbi:MAG: ATP-binding cassette domain-containing protein [Bacteroidales bacterium]|jgi:energy-coupling factor transporter ATP-binding protein EcfA2|nr:ATP-binding cassette domain-containing protein [Bacteroidales bacterium]